MWFLTSVRALGQSFHLSESQASNCKTTTQMICGLLLVGFNGEIFKKIYLVLKMSLSNVKVWDNQINCGNLVN